jgi:hypothetical protein
MLSLSGGFEDSVQMLMKRSQVVAVLALFAFCQLAATAQFLNWYPSNTAPPPGTKYSHELVPLPGSLPGVPHSEKMFIDHVFAMVLRMVQSKTMMMDALQSGKNLDRVYQKYYSETVAARRKIEEEKTPVGMADFKRYLLEGTELQMMFFPKAVSMRASGSTMNFIIKMREAHRASSKLFNAWNQLCKHYPKWSPQLKTSMYSHIEALDVL